MARWLLCLAMLLPALTAQAQVVLKPAGNAGMVMRVKRMSAEVDIEHGLASVKQVLVLQNESSERQEAEFMYALPKDTLVTYFAYWYGEEKVVARIVEKERAAAIYTHITTRMRDPALVEMVGKNSFRARIFPVMPNADLKVELHMVQALRADAKGLFFDLPLRAEKGQPLDFLSLHAHVLHEPGVERIENTLGLSAVTEADGYRLKLEARNYRPEHDLRIRLLCKPAALHASLYAARSGGENGFFALTLVPDRDLANPSLKISGVETSDLMPSRPRRLSAHRAALICGRYRGQGRATVRLTSAGYSAEAPVEFVAASLGNNAATKLWAARRIEAAGDRSEVIRLSTRFTLPSRFTSWLAVPKAEMERYRKEMLEAEVDAMIQRVVEAGERGSVAPELIARLRKKVADLRYASRQDGDDIWWRLEAPFNSADERIEEVRHGGRLGYGRDSDGMFEYTLIRSGTPNPTRAGRLRKRLDDLWAEVSGGRKRHRSGYDWQWHAYEEQQARKNLLAELRKSAPDQAAVQRAEERFRRASNYDASGNSYARVHTETRIQRLENRIELERVDQALRHLPPQDEARTAELRRRADALKQKENELRARMGDPLISVEAPADALQVVALMPGGDVKRLAYNAHSGLWEARFDIPGYAAQGDYTITVIVVRRDGTRQTLRIRYHVDTTAPKAAGVARVVRDAGRTLRLEVDASADAARVAAVRPWGGETRLDSSTRLGRWFALLPVPSGYHGSLTARVIVTDRAHNRTTLTVTPDRAR